VWWMTAGQINTPSPAAITRYAARNVYRRNSETSRRVVRDVTLSDGTDGPTTEFIVKSPPDAEQSLMPVS